MSLHHLWHLNSHFNHRDAPSPQTDSRVHSRRDSSSQVPLPHHSSSVRCSSPPATSSPPAGSIKPVPPTHFNTNVVPLATTSSTGGSESPETCFAWKRILLNATVGMLFSSERPVPHWDLSNTLASYVSPRTQPLYSLAPGMDA